MRIIILILLILSFPLWAADRDFSREQILGLLKITENGLDPVTKKMCEESVEDVSISQCGKDTSKVLGDYVSSVLQLNQLRNQVRIYGNRSDIRNNPGRRSRVAAVAQKLQCMRKEFDEYKISCACNAAPKVLAYVYHDRNKEIFLCKPYFSRKKRQYRSAVLLHEVSHKCGTRDWKYLNTLSGEFINSPIESHKLKVAGKWRTSNVKEITAKNADNFEYWAVQGFCLPDYDCKKTWNDKTLTEKMIEMMKGFVSSN